eukprot:1984601-Pyramimonas_sp.AAC.1
MYQRPPPDPFACAFRVALPRVVRCCLRACASVRLQRVVHRCGWAGADDLEEGSEEEEEEEEDSDEEPPSLVPIGSKKEPDTRTVTLGKGKKV